MSEELRAMIVDSAIEYTAHESMASELEAATGWNEEYDIGLRRAIVLASAEADDVLERLTGLVRILMNQEVSDE